MTQDTDLEVERLRYKARLAYLDGRTTRAKALNREADRMAACLRKLVTT